MNQTRDFSQSDPIRSFALTVSKKKNQILNAISKQIDGEMFVRTVITAVQRTPKILDADKTSVLNCIVQCGQLGLLPDSVLGLAYLVPFYNSKKNVTEIQLIIGYKGLVDLARRSGQIDALTANIVYEGDAFYLKLGVEPTIVHIPLPPEKRGDKLGAYAVARFKETGAKQFVFLWASEIEAIRDKTRSAYYSVKGGEKQKNNESPWWQYETDMWMKTAIRRLCKLLPLTPEAQKAVALEEAQEAGVDVPIDVDFSLSDEPNYNLPEVLLGELNDAYDTLNVGPAQRSIEMAQCRGSEEEAKKLLARLNSKVEKKLAEVKKETEKKSLPAKEGLL